MKQSSIHYKSGSELSARSRLIWNIVKSLVFLVGLTILYCLVFIPELGIHMFWNILIPIAPALLVIFTGLWRNVCPLANVSLIPRKMNWSRKKTLSRTQQSKLATIGILSLLLIAPLRHAFFDTHGPATAILLVCIAACALGFGFVYNWKSAWCSGLCPIHPVEKLYGLNTISTLPNTHCSMCEKCVTPCPDSTPGIHPASNRKSALDRFNGNLMVGGFPGFVWGWFQVKDYRGNIGWTELGQIYIFPLAGILLSLVVYLFFKSGFEKKDEWFLVTIFSGLAVALYYWFRIPALIGYGIFPGDGMLTDLTQYIPYWGMNVIRIVVSVFLLWWIVLSRYKNVGWNVRPKYANH